LANVENIDIFMIKLTILYCLHSYAYEFNLYGTVVVIIIFICCIYMPKISRPIQVLF